jgi:hypothetical protein
MGSWGLAVALTLRGGQQREPVGRRAGGAAAKISTALGTLAGTDEALAASPETPAATEGRTQLPCSPNGSGRAPQANIAEVRDPAGVTQTIVRGHFRRCGFPQEQRVTHAVSAAS